MRKRHRRLCLLPLQFAGEPGFELNSPFRNQGEYLFHVLERLPADLGLLVIEHPTAHWIGDIIDDETREYVRGQYPQVTFVDWQRVESAGQYLIHHVDYVIGVSSSLGLQALLVETVGCCWVEPPATVRYFRRRGAYRRIGGARGWREARGRTGVAVPPLLHARALRAA